MPKVKKLNTEVDENTNSTNPDIKVVWATPALELNLETGRQDLNDNFRKIQDAINKLINK